MKNMSKSLLSLGLVATMGTVLLVGCGDEKSSSEKGESGKKVELTFATWDEHDYMKDIAKAYEKQHPNVSVDVQYTTYSDYWTKLEAGLTGNQGADIMTLNVLHVEDYANAGVLMDLTDTEEKSDLKIHDNFPAPLVDGYTVDEKLYAVPKDFDTNAVFYNKEIFDNANIPYPDGEWTFDEFVQTCRDLKEAGLPEGVYPIASNRNARQSTWDATIMANNGYVFNEDKTETGWDKPETIGGIQPWLDLVQEGLSPSLQQMADTDPDNMFAGGQLAMYIGGDYMLGVFDETLEGKYGIVKRPKFNNTDKDIINGLGYGVAANSKHPEEAMDFVLFLGSKEAQEIQAKAGFVISARNDCQELYLDKNKDLNLQVFLDNVEYAELLPHCEASSELAQIEAKYLDQAWKGEISLEEACKSIKPEADAVLDKMNKK